MKPVVPLFAGKRGASCGLRGQDKKSAWQSCVFSSGFPEKWALRTSSMSFKCVVGPPHGKQCVFPAFPGFSSPRIFPVHSTHDNCGTSQASCTPHGVICRGSQRSTHDSWGASQTLCTPVMTFADSLRLCALSVHSSHDNCGTSRAFCTRMVSFADSFRLSVLTMHSTHDNCGRSQAFCTPVVSFADSLSLFALSVHSIHDN